MTIAITPHTRIDNSIIVNMAEIGVYAFAVYAAIKMHLNQATGACFPSYATIALMTGIHRSTVIESVKKLKAKQLVDPKWRFKEDGSYASNQYNFQTAGNAVPAKKQGAEVSAPSIKSDLSTKNQGTEKSVPCGSRPERPPVVAEADPPGRPGRPEQSERNKKTRTIEDVDFMPTDKQKTCQHPAPAHMHLSDNNIIICCHCWGLLDENLKLFVEDKLPAVGVCAA